VDHGAVVASGDVNIAGAVHRIHRALGGVSALLIACWFASGSVMLFARYPELSERERLLHAPLIPAGSDVRLPPELRAFIDGGGLRDGTRLRLSMLEDEPTWSFVAPPSARKAWRAGANQPIAPLDRARALAEVERHYRRQARVLEVLSAPDQWTVGRSDRGDFPLYHAALDDAAGTEVYLAAVSGETVQLTRRSERFWCWLGAIPHWIYPALLRRSFTAWRNTVWLLAGLGFAVACSGLAAGIRAAIVRRRSRAEPVVREPYLRWHQTIGLSFGALACAWLASGAMSLDPITFGRGEPSPAELARLYGELRAVPDSSIARAFARCSAWRPVRELELAALSGKAFALCSAAPNHTRLIDLNDPRLQLRRELTTSDLSAPAELRTEPDAYYYATHAARPLALPYLYLSLASPEDTTFYIAPTRARVALTVTRDRRAKRWLFHALHSWDYPPLYTRPRLWRAWMLACMLAGVSLSLLGLRARHRRRQRQRARAAP
jgi:hypothetical protein